MKSILTLIRLLQKKYTCSIRYPLGHNFFCSGWVFAFFFFFLLTTNACKTCKCPAYSEKTLETEQLKQTIAMDSRSR
jgi:hypothetical protein